MHIAAGRDRLSAFDVPVRRASIFPVLPLPASSRPADSFNHVRSFSTHSAVAAFRWTRPVRRGSDLPSYTACRRLLFRAAAHRPLSHVHLRVLPPPDAIPDFLRPVQKAASWSQSIIVAWLLIASIHRQRV